MKYILKDEYINHVIVKSYYLNQMIYELFMNSFWNEIYGS